MESLMDFKIYSKKEVDAEQKKQNKGLKKSARKGFKGVREDLK